MLILGIILAFLGFLCKCCSSAIAMHDSTRQAMGSVAVEAVSFVGTILLMAGIFIILAAMAAV